MVAAVCSEQEFIDLWQECQSAAEVARRLGVSVRNVHGRRKRIEAKLGTILPCDHPRSPTFKVTIPENGIRVNVDISDGVILVASDCHYWPGIVSTAHRALVTATRELKPAMVVINGDAFDGARISRHPRTGWEARPTVKQELDAVQERLGEIERAARGAKLHWTWGNHDLRFSTRLANLVGEFEGVHGFDLRDHFPMWRFSTSVMVNGHTMIKHRWHGGIHCSYNNVLKSGVSMVCGHTHSLKVTPYSDYSPNTRYGVDTGTLASANGPQFTYGEDGPANHRSGFAVLTFHNGKLLPPELVEVIDENAGLICFRGQVVRV